MSQGPIVIMAGGTGGHIFPGIAVARALKARAAEVSWLGSAGGLETRLVPEAGLPLHTLAIGGVRGKGWTTWLAAPWRLLKAVLAARRILKHERARAVISFGGFAAGPGGLAARLLGVPVFVHEQNSVAGMTNRLLAKVARKTYSGFARVQGMQDNIWLGNPVRADIAAQALPESRFAQRQAPWRILVLGGSQGARALNRVLPEALARLPAGSFRARHQCGAKLIDDARAAYAAAQIEVDLQPFIADMAEAYAWADLIVCRAGALTLAELCAVGVPAVLVPYPHAVDDHQTRNAEALLAAEAAVLIPESELDAERLSTVLTELMQDPTRRLAMAQAARRLAKPNADVELADAVLREAA